MVPRPIPVFNAKIGMKSLRRGIGRRQQVLPRDDFVALVRAGGVAEALRLLLAEEICDPIARHAIEPARDVLDRHQQAIRLHQLAEDVLQDVVGVPRVGHAPANETAQPGLLPLDHFGNPLVLFEGHPLQARRFLHLLS